VTVQRRSLPILRILAVLAALAVLAGAYGIWYLFFRPSGPPPVGASNVPAASLSSIPAPATADGTWKVPIVFADFNIQKPTSFIVLSIDDHGVMELQLHFVHA
jgi:hypothetical protein